VKKMIVIIVSCSATKDDSIPVKDGSRIVQPPYYLDDNTLISRLEGIREHIFRDPTADIGTKITYAFDLYVRAGKVYKDLRKNSYQRLKSMLISGNDIEWFFLSGGYGIINALEAAKKYQATFNKSIAYQKKIPFTTSRWGDTLPSICDSIVSKFKPEWVYVFGSKDYTNFIKQTHFWQGNNTKMFESTGRPGLFWLSSKLDELVNSIFNHKLNSFNEKYSKFNKQPAKVGMNWTAGQSTGLEV
jgi:cytoplasmic iron level regulating protein YaaA (DUF328/UPF0246 family)